MNVKNVNFLDMQLDLTTDTYRPYMKPNSTPIYVSKESNHPSSVLKNIPKSVNMRLSKISSSKEIFDSAIPPFQEALLHLTHLKKEKENPQEKETLHISTHHFLVMLKPIFVGVFFYLPT